MNKNNKANNHPINVKCSGPTIEELELLLNRIEELDAKWESEVAKSEDSKQAA